MSRWSLGEPSPRAGLGAALSGALYQRAQREEEGPGKETFE